MIHNETVVDQFSLGDEWETLRWNYQVERESASLWNLIYFQETSMIHGNVVQHTISHTNTQDSNDRTSF